MLRLHIPGCRAFLDRLRWAHESRWFWSPSTAAVQANSYRSNQQNKTCVRWSTPAIRRIERAGTCQARSESIFHSVEVWDLGSTGWSKQYWKRVASTSLTSPKRLLARPPTAGPKVITMAWSRRKSLFFVILVIVLASVSTICTAQTTPQTRNSSNASSTRPFNGMVTVSPVNASSNASAANRSSNAANMTAISPAEAQAMDCKTLVSITIDPSREARIELGRLLQRKTLDKTLQLIFVYFNLVVGNTTENTTYHPGSCPPDGRSEKDAKTPLSWAIAYETNGRSVFHDHSFARAYLTLPVSHPRLYSLGYLDGDYVRYINHYKFNMSIEVTDYLNFTGGNDISCWDSLSDDTKAALVTEQVLQLVRDIENQTTPSWEVCYSDPVKTGLTTASYLTPHTPAYVCVPRGQLQPLVRLPLHRDNLLHWFRGFLIVLGIAAAALQLYIVFLVADLAVNWGNDKQGKPAKQEGENKSLKLRENFFSNVNLPVRVTIGGLLNDARMFGPRAFRRLKIGLLLLTLFTMYLFWPLYHMLYILSGRESESSSGDRLLYPDSFGVCGHVGHLETSIDSRFAKSMFAAAVILPFAPLVGYVIISQQETVEHVDLLKASRFPIRWGYSFVLAVICFARPFLCIPLRRGHSTVFSEKSPCYAKMAWPFSFLSWLLSFIFTYFIISLCLLAECILAAYSPAVAAFVVLSAISTKYYPFTWALSFFIGLYLPLFYMLIYTIGIELVTYSLLTFFGLYLQYSTPTFMITSWVVSFAVEVRKTLTDYRAPLLAIWGEYIDKVKEVIKDKKGLAPMPKDHGPTQKFELCLKSFNDQTEENGDVIDWKTFLDSAEPVFDQACYRIMEDDCPDTPIAAAYGSSTEIPDKKRFADALLWATEFLTVTFPPSKESDQDIVTMRECVQHFLRVKLCYEIVKLTILLVVLLTTLMILLAFNGLWGNAKDVNSLLFTVALLPLFAFYRRNAGSPALNQHQLMLVKKIVTEGIDQALEKATTKVSKLSDHTRTS